MKDIVRCLVCSLLVIFIATNTVNANSAQERMEKFPEKIILIEVNFTTGTLYLSQNGNIVKEYPVVLPLHQNSKGFNFPVLGIVEHVVYNAWWYPTKEVKELIFTKKGIDLPDKVPPGDPRNAMGKGKIQIVFIKESNVPSTVRIHGNAKKEDLHKRKSNGCIRMLDDHWVNLANYINGSKAIVVFQK